MFLQVNDMHNRDRYRHIVGIDVLRFFAAFIVMMYHLSFYAWKGGYLPTLKVDFGLLAPVSSVGWIGVEIFFTISGFVIAFSANDSSPWQFFRGRVLRLIPAAWLCASLTAIFMLLDGISTKHVVGLLGKAFIFWSFAPFIDGSYWTLGVELLFYALVFASLAMKPLISTERVIIIIGLVGSLFWFTTFITDNPHLLSQFDQRYAQLLLQYNSFFALGAIAYYSLFNKFTFRRCALSVIFICASSIAIYYRCVSVAYWPMLILVDKKIAISTFAIPESLWILSYAIIIFSVVRNSSITNTVSGYLYHVRLLGLMTYPLYLIHQQVGYIIMGKLAPWIGSWLSLCCAVTFSFSVAFVVASVAEPRLRQFIASLLDGRLASLNELPTRFRRFG